MKRGALQFDEESQQEKLVWQLYPLVFEHCVYKFEVGLEKAKYDVRYCWHWATLEMFVKKRSCVKVESGVDG